MVNDCACVLLVILIFCSEVFSALITGILFKKIILSFVSLKFRLPEVVCWYFM